MRELGVWLDDRWKLKGLQTVILENRLLRVVLVPEMGGNIFEIVDKGHNHNLLFNHPWVEPRRPSHGEPAENRWCGGIDELIPTFWESRHRGEPLSLMGEVFSLSWRCDVLNRGPDAVAIYMLVDTFMSPFRVERWLSLRPDSRVLELRHRITNLSDRPFEYLWGLHISMGAPEHYRIDIPASEGICEHYGPDFFAVEPSRYRWPHFDREGKSIDMRSPLPVNWPKKQCHYLRLDSGWFAFTNLDVSLGLGFRFPKETFPYATLQTLWNYRGIRCITLTTASGYPCRLHEAVAAGLAPCLPPGESVTCETELVVYDGLGSVDSLDRGGRVKGSPG